MRFKDAFIEKYSRLTNFQAYRASVETFPQKSIRVNTLKISAEELLPRLEQQGWRHVCSQELVRRVEALVNTRELFDGRWLKGSSLPCK